jgi:hypothetical protein
VDQQQNETKPLLPKLQVRTLLLLLQYHRYASVAAAAITTSATTVTFADATTAVICTYVPAAVTNITTQSTHKFQVAKNNPKKDYSVPTPHPPPNKQQPPTQYLNPTQ